MVQADTSPTTQELHQRLLSGFMKVFCRRPEKTMIVNGASWLEIAAVIFIRELTHSNNLAASTALSYYNSLLGAIARTPGLHRYDVTNAIRKPTLTQRYQQVLSRQRLAPQQAAAATPEDIRQMIATDPQTGAHIAACFLLAGRLGDYVKNQQNLTITPKAVHITYENHKTCRTTGPQRTTAKNLLPEIARIRLMPTTERAMLELLKRHGFTGHSLRRGGALFWEQHGMPREQICNLTMHSSVKMLQRYLSVPTQQSKQ
jgi:hypothetical protein